jgi:hypothetical protein
MQVRRLLFWIGLFAGLPALVATLCTAALWGYPFTPPPISRLLPMSSFNSVGYYALDITADGEFVAFNSSPTYNLSLRDEPYNRPVLAVGTSLGFTSIPDERLAQVADALHAQNWRLFAPDIDYAASSPASESGARTFPRDGRAFWYALPRGYVIEGTAENGTPLVFISASSMNAVDGNDDHYYYYEALFESTGSALALRDWHTFAYDSSGIEFAQWPFWYMAVVLLFAFIYLVTVPLAWLNRWRTQRRATRLAAV